MPEYVVDKILRGPERARKAPKGASVLVLGLAYKKDIDDPRESPAFEMIDRLLHSGPTSHTTTRTSPEAPRMRTWPDLPAMRSVPLTAETLEASDAVVIVTDHPGSTTSSSRSMHPS